MKAIAIFVLLALVVGAITLGVRHQQEQRKTPWGKASEKIEATAQQAKEKAEATFQRAKETAEAKWEDWNLKSEAIREELTQTGKVVRRKAEDLAAAVSDAAADARTTAVLKTKIAQDPDLSVWRIGVDTTRGRVTLAGEVSSHEHIGRAIQLALETDGVREVISTLQVQSQ